MSLLEFNSEELAGVALAPHKPPPKPDPKFSFGEFGAAAVKGVPSGAAKSAGFFADVLGAFGQVDAAVNNGSGGMFSTPNEDEKRQRDEAANRIREQGVNYSSDAGDLFRGVARGYRPDPETAHWASQTIFGVTDLLTRAIGYGTIAGPAVGAVLTGADEALSVSDDLRQRGVPLDTRSAVGAVAGAVTGASIALPIVGQTTAQTVGLVVAGGPAAFITQQAASKAILEDAGQSAIASEYDPLDPAGLFFSTFVPAAFGAYMRHGIAKAKIAEGRAELSRSVAEAWRPSQEAADAARVAQQAELRDGQFIFGRKNDGAAQQAHDNALSRAEEQLARGEPVNVADQVPLTTAVDVDRMTEVLARASKAAEPFVTPEMRVELEPVKPEPEPVLKPADQAETPPKPPEPPQPKQADGKPADPAVQAIQSRADRAMIERGDTLVRLDGMTAPMRLDEFLAAIKAEAAADVADAPLIQAAAECFLQTGP